MTLRALGLMFYNSTQNTEILIFGAFHANEEKSHGTAPSVPRSWFLGFQYYLLGRSNCVSCITEVRDGAVKLDDWRRRLFMIGCPRLERGHNIMSCFFFFFFRKAKGGGKITYGGDEMCHFLDIKWNLNFNEGPPCLGWQEPQNSQSSRRNGFPETETHDEVQVVFRRARMPGCVVTGGIPPLHRKPRNRPAYRGVS